MNDYDGYVQRLSRKISSTISSIEAEFNYDLGNELEIVLIKILREILPDKYGVCNGFVVTQDGEKNGDDIIIYDKLQCPTLRNLEYQAKENIPIEAVFAYIECKNSINSKETLSKALHQVSEVKKTILKREPKRNPNDTYPVYNGKVRESWPKVYPKLKNQPFCIIFSRNYSLKENVIELDNSHQYAPDLLILGENKIATQSGNLGPDGIKGSLFFDEDHWFKLTVEKTEGIAFGLGILHLLQALSWIELVPINWSNILNSFYADNLYSNIDKD